MLARYEARLSVSYATLSMAKLFGMMVVVSHWVACLWGLLAELEGAAAHTWLDEARAVKGAGCAEDDGARCPSLDGPVAKYAIALRSSARLRRGGLSFIPDGPDRYAISLYFSVYTLTSVGYGDVAAQNTAEYFVAAALVAFSAWFWAYTIGNFCSIVATSDQHAIHFHQARRERAMTSLGGGARARRPRGLVVVVV